MVHFITTSTNKEYGSFYGKMARQHKRDRQKRRRKDKLSLTLYNFWRKGQQSAPVVR